MGERGDLGICVRFPALKQLRLGLRVPRNGLDLSPGLSLASWFLLSVCDDHGGLLCVVCV